MTAPTDQDLRERFGAAGSSMDIGPGDPASVRSRAHTRARQQRVTTVLASVALVIGLAVVVPQLAPGPRGPAIDDPIGDPTVGAPTTDPTTEPGEATDETEPSATEEPRSEVGTVTFGPDYPWRHAWFGADGLRLDEAAMAVGDRGVARAVATAEGVVFQPVTTNPPEGPPLGGRIAFWDGAGDPRELAPAAIAQRLLTVEGGRAWFTYRTGGVGEEDEEKLASVALTGGDVDVIGTSNGVESFTDELVFLSDGDTAGPVAYLSCHLQCTLSVASAVNDLVTPNAAPSPDLASGWVYGLAVAPDARGALAFVEGPDPNLEGSAVALVIIDLDGTELARVPLPDGIGYASGRIEFTPDGRDVVASNSTGGYLISDVFGSPSLDRLAVDRGLTFHGTSRPVS